METNSRAHLRDEEVQAQFPSLQTLGGLLPSGGGRPSTRSATGPIEK